MINFDDRDPDGDLQVCVRPAWQGGADLSGRAKRLLIREWVRLGIIAELEPGTDPDQVLYQVQHRHTYTALAASRIGWKDWGADQPGKKISMATGTGGTVRDTDYPEFTGRLMRTGETAIIGEAADGRLICETFKPGALVMPASGTTVPVNRAHIRTRVAGHLLKVWEEADELHCRGIIVDTVTDGRDAIELARAGSVRKLSIEFLPINPKITKQSDQIDVEHSTALLTGLGIVDEGAYRSAQILRMDDRTAVAAARERRRQKELDRLASLDH